MFLPFFAICSISLSISTHLNITNLSVPSSLSLSPTHRHTVQKHKCNGNIYKHMLAKNNTKNKLINNKKNNNNNAQTRLIEM